MDDLSGLSWSSAPTSGAKKPPPMSSSSVYSDMRSTPPTSGRSTPMSGAPGRPKTSTPANDSFANLVSFNSAASGKNLSLQEQQKQLAARKAQEEAQRRAQLDAQYGGDNEKFWESLEKPQASGTTNGSAGISGAGQLTAAEEEEDDILAAFNASAPVDASTNFPVPSSTSSPMPPANAGANVQDQSNPAVILEDDDDPFGLREMKPKASPTPAPSRNDGDDDDILGPLAMPVSQFPKQESVDTSIEPETTGRPTPPNSSADKAIAELVDMGFPVDKAREALAATDSGADIQAAVTLLLNQAHAESQQKAKAGSRGPAQDRQRSGSREQRSHSRPSRQQRDPNTPAWMRADQSGYAEDRSNSRSPATAERDAAQIATEFGSNFFKSANSLWKSGTKRMQQAVQEFNAPSDPSQPRWMREAVPSPERPHAESRGETARDAPRPRQPPRPSQQDTDFTNEAMLLETQRPEPRRPARHQEDRSRGNTEENLRSSSPAHAQRQPGPQSTFQKEIHRQQMERSKGRLNRFDAEDQASQAYISPARRRKAATPSPAPELQPDLFDSSLKAPKPARPANASPTPPSRPSQPSTPLQIRPKVTERHVPPVPAATLQSSHQCRQQGSEAFRKGDYGAAHAAYSKAFSLLPEKHPIICILLSNRALTSLKIGEPKSAIADADAVIAFIGPGKGESEKIELGNGEPHKDMREIFGKALMRKAEALEQLERWGEAAKVWQEAVESGHGGSTSIQGRNRCEKAAGGNQASSRTSTPASTARPSQTKKPAQPPKAARPAVTSAKSSDAVNRLRAANEAADRADSEKFALTDSVDARLAAWKGGKQDNLRALLASLDTVLWPEAAWKKISMAELVLPNKVKIQYMKGIAKVHPDKIPVNATTEQRMIAGAVFSTLNEAWDKFKRENNL